MPSGPFEFTNPIQLITPGEFILASKQAVKGEGQTLTSGMQAGSSIRRNEILQKQMDFEQKRKSMLYDKFNEWYDREFGSIKPS